MRDLLYHIWLSIRQYWRRRRSLRLYWICAKITNEQTGAKEYKYKYYFVWGRNKSSAILKTKVKLDRLYHSPYIKVECRAGYTRNGSNPPPPSFRTALIK